MPKSSALFLLVPLCGIAVLALGSCRDAMLPSARETMPTNSEITPLGVVEVTFSGLGDAGMRSAASIPEGVSAVFAPPRNLDASGDGSIQLELLNSGSFTEGIRGLDGQRYFFATLRVRNAQSNGAAYDSPRQNLTFLAVRTAATRAGTAIRSMKRYDGTDVDSMIALSIVPTGAVILDDSATMKSTFPDVLQVLSEAEAGAVPKPAAVLDVLPYGFVARNPRTPNSRTLPANPGPNDWDGLVTLAFRYPLQATPEQDPFNVGITFLLVDDSETKLTESIEEQDADSRNRAKARATALGATTVTVLNGSPTLGFYTGERQICDPRTGGSSGSPTSTINRPGAYTRIRLYYAGETLDGCAPGFQSGLPGQVSVTVPYAITARTMDRYGNVITNVPDTLSLTTSDVTATALSTGVPVVGGQAALTATYNSYGTFDNLPRGRRQRGGESVFVGGSGRTWTGNIDTEWTNGGNWTPVGGTPGALDTAYVPGDRPHYPLFTSSNTIGGVVMSAGASVQPTINVALHDFTVNSSLTFGSVGQILGLGRVLLNGVTKSFGGESPSLPGFAGADVRVSGSYTVSSNVTVTNAQVVVRGGRLQTTGNRIWIRP